MTRPRQPHRGDRTCRGSRARIPQRLSIAYFVLRERPRSCCVSAPRPLVTARGARAGASRVSCAARSGSCRRVARLEARAPVAGFAVADQVGAAHGLSAPRAAAANCSGRGSAEGLVQPAARSPRTMSTLPLNWLAAHAPSKRVVNPGVIHRDSVSAIGVGRKAPAPLIGTEARGVELQREFHASAAGAGCAATGRVLLLCRPPSLYRRCSNISL